MFKFLVIMTRVPFAAIFLAMAVPLHIAIFAFMFPLALLATVARLVVGIPLRAAGAVFRNDPNDLRAGLLHRYVWHDDCPDWSDDDEIRNAHVSYMRAPLSIPRVLRFPSQALKHLPKLWGGRLAVRGRRIGLPTIGESTSDGQVTRTGSPFVEGIHPPTVSTCPGRRPGSIARTCGMSGAKSAKRFVRACRVSNWPGRKQGWFPAG